MRNMKKHLLMIGLKFQISTQVSKDDSKTIQFLRNEALKAKIEELIATKQVNDANDLIQSLRLEISSLRRTLAKIQAAKAKGLYSLSEPQSAADNEGISQPSTPFVPPQLPLFPSTAADAEEPFSAQSVLSFEEWKINNWVNPANKFVISEKDKKLHQKNDVYHLAVWSTKQILAKLFAESSVVASIRAGKEPMKAYHDAEINAKKQAVKKIAPSEVTLYSFNKLKSEPVTEAPKRVTSVTI
jgi:hypothetical protein